MKKLIYLILFIPVIGFGQTYPHQIEPDTTHRMIMMTDTSVIDSPALEFVYFSIDSLVEQIARDTLGLDSSYWGKDSGNALYQKGVGDDGKDNTALGIGAGSSLTTGYDNIFIGKLAGENTTTGFGNTFIGASSGRSNVDGDKNFFFGQQTGSGNVSGENNIFFGFNTGQNQATGDGNIFFGNNVGGIGGNFNYSAVAFSGRGFTTGSYNSLIGYRAGDAITTGSYNFGFGFDALGKLTTGNHNIALGYRAGWNLLTTDGNVFIGFNSGTNNTGSNNVFIGNQSGQSETGSNLLYIENSNSSSPLIKGDFSADSIRINGTFSIRDKTGTAGNFAAFDGDKIVDSGVSTLGDPDQTLSFTNPNLTISGSGGNTIDISGVNYWDTNADGIYTLDNVGINTTPHATHPFYVVGTMWLDGPVRDGNGNFSSGTGNIMTANSGGEFLWESPSNIGLSSFNNDAGFLTSEVDGSTTNELQTLSLSTATLSISSGNAVNLPWYDAGTYVRPSTSIDGVWIPDGLLDKDLQYGTSGQVLSSTGTEEVDWITLPTSPWSTGTGDDIYYNTGVHHVGIGTTNPTTELHVVGDALITGDVTTSGSIIMSGTGDVLDFPSAGNIRDAGGSLGTSGDVLTHDGVGVEWMSIDIAQGVRTSSQTFSSTTYSSITGLSSGLAVGGGIVNTNHIAITTSGYYLVTATTTLSRLSGTDVEAYASLYENSTPIGSEMTVAYLAEGEAQTVSTQTYIYLTSADDISLRVKADDSDSSGFSVGAYNTTITAQLIRS